MTSRIILTAWRLLSRSRTRIALAIVLCLTIRVLILLIDTRRLNSSSNHQSPPNTEFESTNRARSSIPNLPVLFLTQHRYPRRRLNATCAYLPSLFRLRLNQLYWQHARLTRHNTSVYLYAAYYDNRVLIPALNKTAPLTTNVRLLAMVDRHWNHTSPSTLCQFWNDNSDVPSFSSPATFDFIWRLRWGYEPGVDLLPVLITCPLPRDTATVPRVVSLVERPCDDARNAVRVQHSLVEERRSATKKEFAVCVKGLVYHQEDFSVRLVEWLEFLRGAGAHRVFLYQLAVHPNMSRVLRRYQQTGFVDVTPLTLAGDQPADPELLTLYFRTMVVRKRQNEIIPYNDCLYRNLYQYRYVVLLDIDEAIVPTRPELRTWSDMLRDALDVGKLVAPPSRPDKRTFSGGGVQSSFASLCARTVYFFDNATSDVTSGGVVPRYMHMLGHVMRAGKYVRVNEFAKCFHSTLHVLTLHNHYPVQCLTGKCRHLNIPTGSGHLQHYRRDCTYGESKCAEYRREAVLDRSMWRYREEMIGGARTVLNELGFDTET